MGWEGRFPHSKMAKQVATLKNFSKAHLHLCWLGSPATQGDPGPQLRHEHHCQDWERQAASQTCISSGTCFLYPVRTSGNLPLADETILCASNSPKAQCTREDLQGRSHLCPGGVDLFSTTFGLFIENVPGTLLGVGRRGDRHTTLQWPQSVCSHGEDRQHTSEPPNVEHNSRWCKVTREQSRESTGFQLQHGKSSEVIKLTVRTSWTNGKSMPFLGPSSELSLQTTPRKSWGAKKQLLLALAEGGESNHSDTHPQPSPSQRPAAQNLVSEPGGKVFLTLKASSFSVSQGLGKGRSQLQMEIPPH